jgi:hypothetical protein
LAIVPELKPIGVGDRDVLRGYFREYQPATSELTFTNLFIWRAHYDWRWAIADGQLVILANKSGVEPFWLPPVGPPPRRELGLRLLHWLRDEMGVVRPRIERADARFAVEMEGAPDLQIEPLRPHYDYVYRSQDLIELKGARYHAKRNHMQRFLRDQEFQFNALDPSILGLCSDFMRRWCEFRRCDEDMNLLGEWEAIKEALANYDRLEVKGTAALIGGQVEAFTFGEQLNASTAVVHIEKANPEIPGLYAAINQKYCEMYWTGVDFINREQDLGEEGLRKAKLSYHPDHLVEKYSCSLVE